MPLPASHLSTGFNSQGDRQGLELAGLQSPAPGDGCQGPLYPSLYLRSSSRLSCSVALHELTLGAMEPLCPSGSAPECLPLEVVGLDAGMEGKAQPVLVLWQCGFPDAAQCLVPTAMGS